MISTVIIPQFSKTF